MECPKEQIGPSSKVPDVYFTPTIFLSISGEGPSLAQSIL
jgi:hypothetical protein